MKLTAYSTALILVLVGALLVLADVFHPSSDARYQALLGFAGMIVGGALAILQPEKKNDSDPK